MGDTAPSAAPETRPETRITSWLVMFIIVLIILSAINGQTLISVTVGVIFGLVLLTTDWIKKQNPHMRWM